MLTFYPKYCVQRVYFQCCVCCCCCVLFHCFVCLLCLFCWSCPVLSRLKTTTPVATGRLRQQVFPHFWPRKRKLIWYDVYSHTVVPYCHKCKCRDTERYMPLLERWLYSCSVCDPALEIMNQRSNWRNDSNITWRHWLWKSLHKIGIYVWYPLHSSILLSAHIIFTSPTV